MTRLAPKPRYRRNLTHFFERKGAYFLTFNLYGALPKTIRALRLQQIDQRRAQGEARKWFVQMESFLHRPQGPIWLGIPEVARLTQQELHCWDSVLYDLECYTLMPNHVHMIITPRERTPEGKEISLSLIMHTIKQRTARQANLFLQRNGTFWQHENFDRFIRSHFEYERIVTYILENPVKAGLVASWEAWPWTYVRGV